MKSDKNILIAFILNFLFSIFEFIGGTITNSVAVISDSIHDLGDSLSIGISYFLEKKSKQKPDHKFTFGYKRYSVIGSVITTLILLVGSILVIYNAILRIITPQEINYNGMIIFAAVGLVVNFLAAYFTKEGDSLNQKAVNLHMLEDVLGWAVVLVGAIVMRFTDFYLLDPILSIGVAVFIFIHALGGLKEAIDLFLEKTGYEEFLKEESTEEEHRVENLHEFRSILVSVEESLEGENLTGFEKLQIVFDQVLLDDSLSDTQSSEGVVLSTVHSVKGLEFKVVFIVALEDGIFPTIREDVDLEEERRVAYVAMTRAKEKIYLTCAKRRLIYGRNVRNHKSRFLMEYLVHDDINKSVEERNELPKTEGEIILGSKIHHQTFGYGTVVWMDEKLIQVVFEKDGSIRKLFKDHPTITKC